MILKELLGVCLEVCDKVKNCFQNIENNYTKLPFYSIFEVRKITGVTVTHENTRKFRRVRLRLDVVHININSVALDTLLMVIPDQ